MSPLRIETYKWENGYTRDETRSIRDNLLDDILREGTVVRLITGNYYQNVVRLEGVEIFNQSDWTKIGLIIKTCW